MPLRRRSMPSRSPSKPKQPKAAREPVATAAEVVESQRLELAALRAEIQVIKDAPAAEERRQKMQDACSRFCVATPHTGNRLLSIEKDALKRRALPRIQ